MKKEQHNFSRIKHQLFQLRNTGKKNPVWKLNTEQVAYVEKLGFQVIPRVYKISTKSFVNIKNKNGLLKEIHYSKVRYHKNVIFKELNPRQIKMLQENEVKYAAYKYEIVLRPTD